jgi:hypothetical protein
LAKNIACFFEIFNASFYFASHLVVFKNARQRIKAVKMINQLIIMGKAMNQKIKTSMKQKSSLELELELERRKRIIVKLERRKRIIEKQCIS